MKSIQVFELVKNKRAVRALAKKIGLTQIPQESYTLVKLGAKNSSPRGYPDAFKVIRGVPAIVGDPEGRYVWIAIARISEWYKTSPILSVKQTELGFEFETENSFYRLER